MGIKSKSYELDKQRTEMTSRIATLQQQKQKFNEIIKSIQHEKDSLELKNKEKSIYLDNVLEIHRAEEDELERKHKKDLQLQILHFELEKNILKSYCRDRDEKLECLRRISDQNTRDK